MIKSLFDFVLLVKLLQGGSSSGVPEVLSIENVGIDGLGYYQIRFFDTEGLNLLATEWVKAGDDVDTDVSPFSNDEITVLNQNGATIESSSVVDQVGEISGYEYSAGYEGMNIRLDNLTPGETYVVSFKYQTTSGAYFSPGQYTYGYKVFDSPVTSYPTVSQAASEYMPLVEDLNEHDYTLQFTPSGETAYLVFAFPQYSDSVRNYFSIRDLCVKSIMDDVWAVTANSGVIATNILDDVQQDMNLYRARWKVSYWNKLGTSLLHEEYVIDGEDAVWGASKDWSNEAEGEAIAGILDDVSTNINVYRVPNHIPLDWVKSDGSQYINTGYVPTLNTRVVMSCNITPTYQYDTPFGSRVNTSNQAFLVFARSSSSNSARYNIGNGAETLIGSTASNYNNDIIISLSASEARFGSDVVSVSGAGLTNGLPIYLFNLNHNNAPYSVSICGCVMKFYYFQIYENDVLVHDFRPVLDNYDIACLYDDMSDIYFYNSGSGEFIYPREPQAVAWIQSTGTQWIDTGVAGNTENLKVSIEYMPATGYTSEYAVFGSAWTANAYLLILYQNKWRFYNKGGYTDDGIADTSDFSVIETEPMQFSVNGTPYQVSGSGEDDSGHITIFKAGNRYGYGKLKSYKMWVDDVLIHDFKPYLDDAGVACLYDEITQQFYHNVGTGVFGYPYDPTPAEVQLKADMALTDYCRLSYAIGDGATFNGRYFTRTSNTPLVVFMNYRQNYSSGWASYALLSRNSTVPPFTSNSYGDLVYRGTIDINGHTLHLITMNGMWSGSPAGIVYTVDGANVTFPNNNVLIKLLSGSTYTLDGDAQAVADATAMLERFATM